MFHQAQCHSIVMRKCRSSAALLTLSDTQNPEPLEHMMENVRIVSTGLSHKCLGLHKNLHKLMITICNGRYSTILN